MRIDIQTLFSFNFYFILGGQRAIVKLPVIFLGIKLKSPEVFAKQVVFFFGLC